MADPMTNFYQGSSLGIGLRLECQKILVGDILQYKQHLHLCVDPFRTGDTAAQDTLAELYERQSFRIILQDSSRLREILYLK